MEKWTPLPTLKEHYSTDSAPKPPPMNAFFCKKILSDAVLVPAGLLLLAVTALGGALTSQYAFGMNPCPLCIYQRWPYAIIIALSLLALFMELKKKEKAAAALVFLCGLALLAGGAIAAYHVGVEQHWWKSFLEGCTVSFDNAQDLLKQIESTRAARCDEIPWSLFGISMAGYNAIISLIAGPLTLLSSLMIVRRANGF